MFHSYKSFIAFCFIIILFQHCKKQNEISSVNDNNWNKRSIQKLNQNLFSGKTYLSVYSQIYSETEHKKHNLTATVSLRNTNLHDTIFIKNAHYYDTTGKLIRKYIQRPIFILPMETVEIIIDELDKEGGTGANFLFNWAIKETSNSPVFEAVMISTSGQQGLSFTTKGIEIK